MAPVVEPLMMVEPSVTATVPAVNAAPIVEPFTHSKIAPSQGVAGRFTVRETDAVVEISVDAVVLVRVDRVPVVRAVVTTPVAFRTWATLVKMEEPPGPPVATCQVSRPVGLREGGC